MWPNGYIHLLKLRSFIWDNLEETYYKELANLWPHPPGVAAFVMKENWELQLKQDCPESRLGHQDRRSQFGRKVGCNYGHTFTQIPCDYFQVSSWGPDYVLEAIIRAITIRDHYLLLIIFNS